MSMPVELLTECIRRAAHHTQFRNVRKRRFDALVMRELYAKKMESEYRLSNTDAISVRQTELTGLVSELEPMVARYSFPETGAVGNGFYTLMGSLASPRLPSVEDYAKVLILAASRLNPERVAGLFAGWLEGRPVRVWLRALLKGVITEGALKPVDGLCLETLPTNGDDFPRSLYVQIYDHDIRHEQYAQRAMLSLEHEVGPALYSPDGNTDGHLQPPPRPSIRNMELSTVSVDGLCRALSIGTNNYVDWFRQWWDYGDVDAFFLNPGHSCGLRETHGPSPGLVTGNQLAKCLEVHQMLDGFTKLDLGIARWRRSRQSAAMEEQLVELRIALESVLLADDKGVVAEKRYRLATRGAWLLGDTFEERKRCFDRLRKVYGFASSVLHAGSPKEKDRDQLASAIGEAQDYCRKAILRIVSVGSMPNWSDLVLGKGYCRGPKGDTT